MPNTFSVASFRSELAKIIDEVVATGNSVTVERYGDPVVTVSPAKLDDKTIEEKRRLVDRYAKMWKDEKWLEAVGKPSRYFRRRKINL